VDTRADMGVVAKIKILASAGSRISVAQPIRTQSVSQSVAKLTELFRFCFEETTTQLRTRRSFRTVPGKCLIHFNQSPF
jgi:hypothetical protein